MQKRWTIWSYRLQNHFIAFVSSRHIKWYRYHELFGSGQNDGKSRLMLTFIGHIIDNTTRLYLHKKRWWKYQSCISAESKVASKKIFPRNIIFAFLPLDAITPPAAGLYDAQESRCIWRFYASFGPMCYDRSTGPARIKGQLDNGIDHQVTSICLLFVISDRAPSPITDEYLYYNKMIWE